MRNLALALALLALTALAAVAGQQYSPKSGETVMRVSVSGRGSFDILLYTREAPKTTAHIIGLVQSGFYSGQTFYKVVDKPRPFLIQTGDPASKTKPADDPSLGTGGSGKRIPYEETGKPNKEGAVGLAAKPGDKDSGDSQFYVLLGAARFLDGNYTVFGEVVAGMDVVRKVKRGDKVDSVSILRG